MSSIFKTVKAVIKLFLPPVFIKIFYLLKEQNVRIVSTISQLRHSADCLYVIGNGPSLSESLSVLKLELIHNDCVAVNNFCITDIFTEIKPKLYVIADPSNLGEIENLSDLLKEETFAIAKKLCLVDWDINLIVPDFSKTGYLVNAVKKNPHVRIYFYNTYDKPRNDNMFDNWSENCIAPPAQTVLNTCVYLGIFWEYKEIHIIGMDMSWHEDLYLDQKTNELFIIDRHFYGTQKRLATLDVNGVTPAKVHEYLQCSVNALKSFWELKAFADYKGVRVYNSSPHSWVDAFDRR